MKQINSHIIISLIFVFLICFHISDARLLAVEQAVEEKANTDHKEIMHEESFLGITDDLLDLMGSKGCDDKDEECLKRRMIAEAHLDYIYTQHHKP